MESHSLPILKKYASGTISYTSLLYSSTNQEDGGLDITTGVFTAPWGGSYTVSWDTSAELEHGELVDIYLNKNGNNIEESRHSSYYGGNDYVSDQGKLLLTLLYIIIVYYIIGGRTLVVYLAMGDTLQPGFELT